MDRSKVRILIDALRKGRKKYPRQGSGTLYRLRRFDNRDDRPEVCALGAIAAGLGLDPAEEPGNYARIKNKFKELGIPITPASIYNRNDGALRPFGSTAHDIDPAAGDRAVIRWLEDVENGVARFHWADTYKS